jgi:hypothetical protein
MWGIINNIINSYNMQAKALSVLVTNTQKALEQSEKERKANEQIQRVENFVKDLTMNLNNMLAKFHFLKDRKNRKQEQMTDSQVKAVTEFAIFVKTLTKKVCSLLNRLQENQTFEEKIDKEIRELETGIGQKLKEFDKALEETSEALTIRIVKHAGNIISGFVRILRIRNVVLAIANRRKLDRPLKESSQNIENYQVEIPNPCDSQLENLFNGLSINSTNSNSNEENSKCQRYLNV